MHVGLREFHSTYSSYRNFFFEVLNSCIFLSEGFSVIKHATNLANEVDQINNLVSELWII